MQIVYILDQVRALEHEMIENIDKQGLEIIPQIIVVGFKLFSYL
jgi:sucrose synthase